MPKPNCILLSLERVEEGLPLVKQAAPDTEVRVGPYISDDGQYLPADILKGVDVLYCEWPAENFNDLKELRWLQLTSAGYSHILKLPLLQRGIKVSNGLGTFDIPIAEWTMMMVLAWHRRLLELLENQKHAIWDRGAKFQNELRGSTIGFWGYGGIARETTRIAKAMGLNVWALTRDGNAGSRSATFCVPSTGDPDGVLPDRFFRQDQQQEFLTGLDYLVLTIPLTNATKGLIGEAQLKMLQPHAVLINPARAPIVQEEALLRALRENWFRGTSFDVHYAYPLPPEHPLWRMPNVILTPHISGHSATSRFVERSFGIFCENLRRYAADESLLNQLTERQLRGE